MEKSISNPDSICSFLDCEGQRMSNNHNYCEFHNNGGMFSKGDTYEQYQIIEMDFINFIKIVPINNPKHLIVESTILRDIIIRCCVQIELFLKEWCLFYCSEYKTNSQFTETSLWKKYNEINKQGLIKKMYNWSIGSYFFIKGLFDEDTNIYVRPMDKDINPFKDWKNESTPPKWWSAYNKIKHGGKPAKGEEANLENALYALSALFYLHCENKYTKSYLKQFGSFSIVSRFNQISVEFESITTPIDSKQYLFRYNSNSLVKKYELVSKQQIHQSKKKGYF
ncbi:MAG: hypothetical protein ACYC25_12450 [Paludibacter sp.]